MKNYLIAILVIIILVLCYLQFKPESGLETTNQLKTASENIDPVTFFSELKNSPYLILDYTGSSNDHSGGNYLVTKKSDNEIKDGRLNLLNKTCGTDSSGYTKPCIFITSVSVSDPGMNIIPNKPRILAEWSPIVEGGAGGNDVREEYRKGSLGEYGISSSETLVFETEQYFGCEMRINKYNLNIYRGEVQLVESGSWNDICGD